MSISFSGHCQTGDSAVAPGTRQELWPEIDLYYRLNEKFRFFASYSATQLKSSSYTDGGLSANIDYFALPLWRKAKTGIDSLPGNLLWLRGGFLYSASAKDVKDPSTEYTITTEANIRFFLPYELLLTNKNRFDWRFVNGDFVPRYRPRLTLERDLATDYLSFNAYLYIEYFLNFVSGNNNRLRLCIGSELKVAKHINFEVYFVHQFENQNHVPTVNAIGVALKVYWKKGDPLFTKKKKDD